MTRKKHFRVAESGFKDDLYAKMHQELSFGDRKCRFGDLAIFVKQCESGDLNLQSGQIQFAFWTNSASKLSF